MRIHPAYRKHSGVRRDKIITIFLTSLCKCSALRVQRIWSSRQSCPNSITLQCFLIGLHLPFHRLFPSLVLISYKVSQLSLIRWLNMIQSQTRYTQWSARMAIAFRNLWKLPTNSSVLLWPTYRRSKLSFFRKSSKKRTSYMETISVCDPVSVTKPLSDFHEIRNSSL
jgi:hypothetical protein